MSDLLNKASLVMIPSGYKEDVVYSAIPSDGSGDLSFTRASNGTRINSAGLVEDCPWNFMQQSETFDNASWSKLGATVTANDITAPNGTLTADKVVFSGANNSIYQAVSLNGEIATRFVYIKGTAGETISIDDIYVSQPNITLTGDWQLIGFTSATPSLRGFGISTYGGATARTIWLWGAQLNIGSTAKPYFPTTDRLNVPRLTYQNGGGGCPSLLLEKQSTNVLLWSQAFTNTWATYNGTTTDNETISPDGTQNASKVIMGAGNSATIRQAIGGLTNGSTYTFSLYIKQGSGVTAFLDISDTASTVNITPTSEWVRYTYTANWNTSLNFVDIELRGTSGSAYCYIYGAQLEASSYPTSYIPTTSASATRVADVMTVNLPNTDMTFCAYLECEEAPLGTTAGDWLAIYSDISILGRAYGYANTFGFADAYGMGITSATKMVWKQESGTTAKLFKNGALVATSTTGTYSDPFNRFAIDGNYLDKPLKVKQFIFFQNNLTDAECASLTA